MKIFAVIVTYNIDLMLCKSYQTLLRKAHLPFLIYENSPVPMNRQYEGKQVYYQHNPDNGGVSAAYNAGARIAREQGFDYVLLLDEDTTFETDFIDKLHEAHAAHPQAMILAPRMVYQEDKPFSPVRLGKFAVRAFKPSQALYPLGLYVPVNSGACIQVEAFLQSGGYNENMKLDFADFDFFSRLSHTVKTFAVVNSTARQSFSNDEQDVSKLIHRYQIYLECAWNFKMTNKRKIDFYVARHSLALLLKTKDMTIVRLYLKYLSSSLRQANFRNRI